MGKRNKKVLFLLIASIAISFMAGYELGRINGLSEGYKQCESFLRKLQDIR